MSELPPRQPGMAAMDAIARLEDLTLTAWPALRTLHHDGWLLRFSAGHTGRANSVNAIAPGRLPLETKIAFVEDAYRAQALDPLFRVTPLSPPGLDAALADRGYAMENPSLVKVLDGLTTSAPGAPDVTIASTATGEWIDAYCSMTGVTPVRRAALTGILSAIVPATLYGALVQDGLILAVALAVVDRGHVGLFDVATHPDHRGKGLAGRVIGALLTRAAGAGAEHAYLQVGAANAPALSLYERLGFRTAYPYHYRRLGWTR